VERLFVQKWSNSDMHKKARSFADPLDVIVRHFLPLRLTFIFTPDLQAAQQDKSIIRSFSLCPLQAL